jgi:hypothetical protein
MFGWWGKVKPSIVDQEPLVEEAPKELATIRQWDLATRTSFSVFFSKLWRQFMDDFDGPSGSRSCRATSSYHSLNRYTNAGFFSATKLIG